MNTLFSLFLFFPFAIAQQQCGQTPIKPELEGKHQGDKIVGGSPAIPGSWPWQVSLRLNSGTFHTCGASILCRNIILTAAHCVHNDRFNPQKFEIHVGRYYRTQDTAGITKHRVTKIITHERWNQFTIDEDIAVLSIDPPITYSNIAQPVCFPNRDVYVGEMALLSGWGQTMGTGWDNELKQAFIPVISNDECRQMINVVSPNMLCTGYPQGGHGVCFGDSGGPLSVRDGNKWIQIGIVSWTAGRCNHPRTLSGYARVRQYMNSGWLVSKINELGGCN
jgi:plasminogen